MIDTHCHFNHTQFADDTPGAVIRANASGVGQMIVVGFDLESSKLAIEIANKYPQISASIGIHPHEASAWNSELEIEFRELLRHPQVVALGEIGLDYYRDLSPRIDQANAFDAQLGLAREFELPVIIHCREAYDDTLTLIAKMQQEGLICGVMHCWAGAVAEAQRTLELGFYLGIGGSVTYKGSDAVREAVRNVPFDRILLETDSPYLAPVPHRGKRNEPAYTALVAAAVADLKVTTLESVDDQTTANAYRCFPRLPQLLRTG